MTLEINDAERELLLIILKGRLSELREEIHHSMVSTFTDELKERQKVLQGLIERLEADSGA